MGKKKKIKILIADDHQLITNGIKMMIGTEDSFEIIGEANDGNEVIAKASVYNPDVIIMDISMPEVSGIEATKKILQKLPDIKVLALTQHEDSIYVMQMLDAGAMGYLLKNSNMEEFVEAIYSVYNNKKYFSKRISDQLLNNLLTKNSKTPKQNSTVSLTKRERQITKKIAEELSNQQIADQLNISLRTVETHRRNIMQKLNIKNTVSLVKYAVQHNLISFD